MLICLANIARPTRTNRRSYSAPSRTNQTETLRPREDVIRENSEVISPPQQELNEEALPSGDRRKSMKRASSVLLPAELIDFVFPRLQRRAFDADGRKIEVRPGQSHPDVSKGESESEIRPAVPPKTPPKQLAPTLQVSPLKLRPTKAAACDKALPQIGGGGTPPLPPDESPKGQGESKHVRDGSGDSVIDRGRPQKRTRSQVRKGIMGSRDGSSVDLTSDVLPRGWLADSVSVNLSGDEIRKLEHQARSQTGRFEVLHLKDVKALSQVCSYLVSDDSSNR